jgi:hypothetical protein
MKTLADLKRELVVGTGITLVKSCWNSNSKIGKKRYVVKTQGNGVYLSENKDDTEGSFLPFPNAKLTEYTGDTLTVFQPGKRPFTQEELDVYNNMPSHRPENAEIVQSDVISDGSTSYWMDVKYFKEKNMRYLHNSSGTKHADYNSFVYDEKRMKITSGDIIDEQIRGELELQYAIEH